MTVYFFEDLLHLLTAGFGPTRPTWALRQVGSYLGYTGRDADVVAKAAHDPELTCWTMPSQIVPAPTKIFSNT
jgi:hypothetical protein